MNVHFNLRQASRSAAVKARLDHPVIDTDLHVNDYAPGTEVGRKLDLARR